MIVYKMCVSSNASNTASDRIHIMVTASFAKKCSNTLSRVRTVSYVHQSVVVWYFVNVQTLIVDIRTVSFNCNDIVIDNNRSNGVHLEFEQIVLFFFFKLH